MAIHACTIIARNYLASARVLFESFIESNPDGTLTVLIIDDRYRSLSKNSEGFEILQIDEIGLDHSEVLTMAALYTVTEFATAVKPWLLQTLIERWNEPVIYLDPDIMVFRSLETIHQLATEHEIVITPHASRPIPRDQKKVSESEILAVGIYNLGFIGVGITGITFLEFWKERLKRECIADPTNMRFVDQRWVDFAPAMFDAFILKAPTYNVAYWNLFYLDFRIDRSTNQYLVDGQPIHFFHFSGYDPKVPELLSKYQSGQARILFSDEPELKELCDFYGSRLMENDYKTVSAFRYEYSTLDNGMRYDTSMRAAYRRALLDAEENEFALPPNPFVSSECFLAWLNSPVKGRKISRYLAEIYDNREDLQFHFPDADGPGIVDLLNWCWDEALEDKFDPRLIPALTKEAEKASKSLGGDDTSNSSPDSIQIAGYFKAEMGVGELGRNTIKAVRATGIPYSTVTDTDVVHRQNLEFEDRKGEEHAVNIVCVNADSLVHFAYRVGPEYFRGRYTIGVWAWELEEFPTEFDSSFENVDEVWGCSKFTRDAIASRGLKTVHVLPITVEPPKVIENFDHHVLGIPDAYTFLFCFDLLSVFERKNPLGLIDAFTSAFTNGEGPVLVIKALNGDKRLAELERIRMRVRDRSDVIILDKYLDYEDNVGLFNAADCYVSLHRSEGLGLTIAEAMSLGKPVIATAYSGNMDFMNSENSYLIPFSYGEVPEGCEPYRAGARWAEPDISKAAETMRYVFNNQDEAVKIGERARHHMLEKHSPQATSAFIVERYSHAMNELHGLGSSAKSYDAKDNQSAVLEISERTDENRNTAPPLVALATRPVEFDGPSRFPRVSRLVRGILKKLLLVHDNQQQEFNTALAMGTEHLARLWNGMQGQLDQVQLTLERNELKHLADQHKGQTYEMRLDRMDRRSDDQNLRIFELERRNLDTDVNKQES